MELLNEENGTRDLNVLTNSKITDASKRVILKRYCDYLLKDKQLESNECKTHINAIMSIMLDKGDISLPIVEEINKYIITTKSKRISFINKCIVDVLNDIDVDESTPDNIESLGELKSQVQLRTTYDNVALTNFNYFGNNIKKELYEFVNSYNKLFDNGFNALIKS